MKRIVLFLVTNLAVMLVLSIAASVLGVNRFLHANGLDLGMLLGFAAIMGFGGSFISLLMSKMMAKWSTGARIIGSYETVRRPVRNCATSRPRSPATSTSTSRSRCSTPTPPSSSSTATR